MECKVECKVEFTKSIRLKDGVKTMTFDQCLKQFERFLYSVAKSYENTGYPRDELKQLCLIGLWKAYTSYNIEKKTAFMTYATRVIFNEVNMALRKNKKTCLDVSFYEPLNIDYDGNQLLLADIVGVDGMEDYILLKMQIKEFISKLHDREKYILIAISENKTQNQIAAELNISQSYASRIMNKLKNKLRTQIGIKR